MKTIILPLFLGLLAISQVRGQAQGLKTRASDASELNKLLREWTQAIQERHPQLKSLEQHFKAQSRRVKPSGILPDPTLGITFRNIGNPVPFTTLGEAEMSAAGLMLQQTIPWKGKLHTRRTLAEKMAEMWNAEYWVSYWELVGGLKKQVYELAFQQEQLSILQENKTLLNQIIAIAEALYSVGKGIQADVLRAYTERSSLDEKITDTDGIQHTLIQQIRERYLVDPEFKVPRLQIPTTIPDLPEESRLLSLMEGSAPRIANIKARIEIQNQIAQLSYLDRYPDFSIRAGWFSRGQFPDMYEIGFGLNIPVFAGVKQIPLHEAEREDLAALNQQLEDIRFRLRWGLQDNFIRAHTARRLIELYRTEILPQSQADFESTLDNYQTGRVDFLNVMDRWLRWLNFRIGFFRQLADYYQSLVSMEEIVGTPVLTDQFPVSHETKITLESYISLDSRPKTEEVQP